LIKGDEKKDDRYTAAEELRDRNGKPGEGRRAATVPDLQ
jgi:hypothetical protein